VRQETRDIALAFKAGRECKRKRTYTNGVWVSLHGNDIFIRQSTGKYYFSLAGWGTSTTRERINGILEVLGEDIRVCQRDHCQYIAHPDGSMELIDPYGGWYAVDTADRVLQQLEERE